MYDSDSDDLGVVALRVDLQQVDALDAFEEILERDALDILGTDQLLEIEDQMLVADDRRAVERCERPDPLRHPRRVGLHRIEAAAALVRERDVAQRELREALVRLPELVEVAGLWLDEHAAPAVARDPIVDRIIGLAVKRSDLDDEEIGVALHHPVGDQVL